jgi:hypothetical protein
VYDNNELIARSDSHFRPGLVVKDNLPERGRGLFSACGVNFAKGMVICDYKGNLMSH